MRRRSVQPRGFTNPCRVFATEPALSDVEGVGILTSTLTLRKAKQLTDERSSLLNPRRYFCAVVSACESYE